MSSLSFTALPCMYSMQEQDRNKECGDVCGGAGVEKNNHASQWTGRLNSAMLCLSVPEITEANNFSLPCFMLMGQGMLYSPAEA